MNNFYAFFRAQLFSLKKFKLSLLAFLTCVFPLHLSFKQKYELASHRRVWLVSHYILGVLSLYKNAVDEVSDYNSSCVLIASGRVFRTWKIMTEWLYPVSFWVDDRGGSLLFLVSCVIFLTDNCRLMPLGACCGAAGKHCSGLGIVQPNVR